MSKLTYYQLAGGRKNSFIFHPMTRLSLHDPVDNGQRRLPICRMCCRLFVDADAEGATADARKLAAFSPCGHVFHYNCIMERYERMEDSCNCVTCFSRMDNPPIVLYMEWSKNVRQVSKEETQEIEMMTAPHSDTTQLREDVGILKLKLESLAERKQHLIRKLNDVSDASAIARSTCEGLDDQCESMLERVQSLLSSIEREKVICNDLNNRILRDKNKAILIDLVKLLELPESSDMTITEFFKTQLSNSNDPDDLLKKLAIFYDSYHRNTKESSRAVAQLKTVVQSVKKEFEIAEKRLINAKRNQKSQSLPQITGVPDTKKKRTIVVDRKTVPMKPTNAFAFAHDDLAPSRKGIANSLKFFN